MATFLAHGLIGAASLGWISKRLFWWLVVVGFVLGSLPDTADWLAWVLGLADRWVVYSWFHTQMSWWLIVLVWPTGLHVLIDLIFHANSPHWWPTLWWLEILMWVVPLVILWYLYRSKHEADRPNS